MEQTYKRISRVENYLSMMLAKAKISDHVFFGNLPATINKEWTDMVMVDVQAMHDYDSFAKGSANIFLYAKSTDDESSKPVKKLNAMEVALDKALEEDFNKNYATEIQFRNQDYDTNAKYYYNVVNVEIIAK